MDWNRAIERNREALKRALASLVAMAGLAGFTFPPHPELVEGAGEDGSARRGNLSAEAQQAKAEAEALAEPGEGYLHGRRPTLPRHLHRAVLRLLRPAEAAVRRLVIVAARDVVVTPPAPRKPKQKSAILRGRVGTGIILPRNAPTQAAPLRPGSRTLVLPLVDPLYMPRLRRQAARGIPRISSFSDFSAPAPVPVRRPISPDDPIDATRLALRLTALARALDDLPREARRFARWKLRRDRGLVRRISPLRPGRPPGRHSARSRRPAHEVHEVLGDLQYFAFKALLAPDTS